MRRSSQSLQASAPRLAASWCRSAPAGSGWCRSGARVGRRFGLRRWLQVGYVAADVLSSIFAALAFGTPWLGAPCLCLAALGTEAIDGARNLLFLRAVHPCERPEMTTVFVSFRDVAKLGPPTVFSLLLSLLSIHPVTTALRACGDL